MEDLNKIIQLRNEGAISDEEFKILKHRIIYGEDNKINVSTKKKVSPQSRVSIEKELENSDTIDYSDNIENKLQQKYLIVKILSVCMIVPLLFTDNYQSHAFVIFLIAVILYKVLKTFLFRNFQMFSVFYFTSFLIFGVIILNENFSDSAINSSSAEVTGNSNRLMLDGDIYEYKSSAGSFYLEFESDDGLLGAAILTIPNGCSFYYGFTLEGSYVDLTPSNSTCGGNMSATSMKVNIEENTITANIKGQRFVFRQ